MDIEQFRKAGYAAIDQICDYFQSMESLPVVSKVEPGYLKDLIPGEAPEQGEDFAKIAEDYQKVIIPGLTRWQHPSFFAYFPTGCTFEGILADLYSSSVANPGFNWSASPACTELEVITMDWAAKMLGLSPAFYNSSEVGGGVVQTSASDSVLVAVVAARSRFLTAHPDTKMEDLVIYSTTQTHSLAKKAAVVLGLQIRSIEVEWKDKYSLKASALEAALDEDAKLGRKPFILIATVGTTSSGAVDDIPEIAAVLESHPEIWLHIDAAWAGVALACPEHRESLYLPQINESATSFCTNFHKWGLVNFDLSAMWVRDRKLLTEALDVTPFYLRTKQGDEGTAIDYRNWHLGLGRKFRSIKLWFVLRSYGTSGFQAHIRKGIELNNLFASLVRQSKTLSLVTEPSLALTVFRVNPPQYVAPAPTTESLNELNARFFKTLSARDDLMLTQTNLNGEICIRLAVGSVKTEETHIRKAYEIIEQEAAATIQSWAKARASA